MTGEGGKVEAVGGNSERKARIVGRFVGILLVALMIVLLLVVGFLLLRGKFMRPSADQPHKQSRITSSLFLTA